MKRRKALVSEEELDKVRKASKKASETREQTLHMQARTEPNTYDKHKQLSSSLHRGFCTSVLFIYMVNDPRLSLLFSLSDSSPDSKSLCNVH